MPNKSSANGNNAMTSSNASRIQASQARLSFVLPAHNSSPTNTTQAKSGGDMSSGGFAARAQAAAATNANNAGNTGGSSNTSGRSGSGKK